MCLVAALDDLRHADFTRVGIRPCPHIHRTRDVYFDKDVDPAFPLTLLYDLENRSLARQAGNLGDLLGPILSQLTSQSSHPPPVPSEGGVRPPAFRVRPLYSRGVWGGGFQHTLSQPYTSS